MTRQGIITATQDTIADVAKGARSVAGSAAEAAAKVATGAVLRTVKGARRLVGTAPARRKRRKKSVARKARKTVVRRAKTVAARAKGAARRVKAAVKRPPRKTARPRRAR
jgi:hypothetical protein